MSENNLCELYLPYIIQNWKQNGVSDELLNKINFFFPEMSEKNSDVCLLHIACLMERGLQDDAVNMLNFYLSKFGTANIERCLPAASLADSLGIYSDSIKKASDLFHTFEKNKDWYKFLINKTVAVVGNGPEELGKGHGKEIDAHDIVIRFNSIYRQCEYEKDYGKKTDIWVKNVRARYEIYKDPKFLEINKNIILDLLKFDYWHNFVNDLNYFLFSMQYSKNSSTFYTVEDIKRCRRYSKILTHIPSTGFPIALYLYENREFPASIDFYGFSFLNQDIHFSGHFHEKYSEEEKRKAECAHSMYEEACVLRELFLK